jgi:Spy/CpxP family protein refolding chaperone
MKTRTFLTSLLLVAGLACGTAFEAAAQGGGGGGGGGGGRGMGMGMRGALTPEQVTQINDAVQADMVALTQKLTDAQKAAVTAALAKDATEASVKAKLEAVAKVQTDIAVLRFNKGVKAIASSVTDEQKTQMDTAPGMAYQQLFGGAGGRGGRGGGGGAGGAGGARRGGGGGGGGN